MIFIYLVNYFKDNLNTIEIIMDFYGIISLESIGLASFSKYLLKKFHNLENKQLFLEAVAFFYRLTKPNMIIYIYLEDMPFYERKDPIMEKSKFLIFIVVPLVGSMIVNLDCNHIGLLKFMVSRLKLLHRDLTGSSPKLKQKEDPPSRLIINIDINMPNNLNFFGSNNHLSNNSPLEKEKDKNNDKEKRTSKNKES